MVIKSIRVKNIIITVCNYQTMAIYGNVEVNLHTSSELRTVFIGENIGELEMEESQSNGCD
jgi:hypothetical protein